MLLLHHVTPTPQFLPRFGPSPATPLCVSDLMDFFEGTILSCLKQGFSYDDEERAGWQGLTLRLMTQFVHMQGCFSVSE